MYMNVLRQYAIFMLYMSVALTIVGLTDVFPYDVEIAGVSTSEVMDGIEQDWGDIQNLVESGNIVEYAIAIALLAWEGVKIIIAVAMFVLGGFGAVLSMFGIPNSICILLQVCVDFLILFELGQHLFMKQ